MNAKLKQERTEKTRLPLLPPVKKLDPRFGYKIFRGSKEHCFFRFLDNAWHDVLAEHDFGHSEAEVMEVIGHELGVNTGPAERQLRPTTELIIFGCCCAICDKDPALKAAARELAGQGFKVSHGYWPEHSAAEDARLEREMHMVST
jgi:hypothetical protein